MTSRAATFDTHSNATGNAVYQIDQGTREFRIQAEGFEPKTVSFPGKGQSTGVILKRR